MYLPGFTVTVKEELEALAEVEGKKALDLVDFKVSSKPKVFGQILGCIFHLRIYTVRPRSSMLMKESSCSAGSPECENRGLLASEIRQFVPFESGLHRGSRRDGTGSQAVQGDGPSWSRVVGDACMSGVPCKDQRKITANCSQMPAVDTLYPVLRQRVAQCPAFILFVSRQPVTPSFSRTALRSDRVPGDSLRNPKPAVSLVNIVI